MFNREEYDALIVLVGEEMAMALNKSRTATNQVQIARADKAVDFYKTLKQKLQIAALETPIDGDLQ
jgi:hypothetical protein